MNRYLTPTLLVLLLTLASQSQSTVIPLTFFIEHEVENDKDYIEMIVQVKTEDTSLKTALEQAANTVSFVRS